MTRMLALAALGVLLGAGPATSQNPSPRPEGLPPIQRETIFKDGFLISKVPIIEFKEEVQTRTVKGPDGKAVEEKVKMKVPVTRLVEQKIDPKKAAVQRADGKAVNVEELAKLLEKPGMVFFAAEYSRVDPFFLQFLKPDTLVVVPERPVVAVPLPGPGPAPKP